MKTAFVFWKFLGIACPQSHSLSIFLSSRRVLLNLLAPNDPVA